MLGYLILGGLALVCGAGWFFMRISALTLAWWIVEQDCPMPTRADVHRGTRYVVWHLFRKDS